MSLVCAFDGAYGHGGPARLSICYDVSVEREHRWIIGLNCRLTIIGASGRLFLAYLGVGRVISAREPSLSPLRALAHADGLFRPKPVPCFDQHVRGVSFSADRRRETPVPPRRGCLGGSKRLTTLRPLGPLRTDDGGRCKGSHGVSYVLALFGAIPHRSQQEQL